MDQSKPLEWPADLSALRNSAVLPPGPRINPGAGVRINSRPSNLDASAMARACPNNSPAFSRVDAHGSHSEPRSTQRPHQQSE